MKELEKHLKEKGKTASWISLANEFSYLVGESDKKRSDSVRRLFSKLNVTPQGDPNNVLVIGDIHEPFCKEGYLEFCQKQQQRFNCGTVIFIGDIIDSHFSSFHHIDPDGMSAGMELTEAIKRLKKWYVAFPNAQICLGNHDRIWSRKLYAHGISARLLKPFEEILGTPNWKFVEQVIHNNVLYIHGESGSADTKLKQEFISVVQGHHHTEAYIKLFAGTNQQLFAMQVGTGIDFESYAFGYAQRGKKPVLSCGVILDQSPIIIPFNG